LPRNHDEQWRRGFALCLALALAAGCTENPSMPRDEESGVRYPLGMVGDRAGSFLMVAGTNFDRRYRAGVVRVVQTATDTWMPKNEVEVPSFAGNIALLPDAATQTQAGHLVVPARDDDSLTIVDLAAGATPILSCGTPDAETGVCASSHRVGALNANVTVGNDPLDVAFQPGPNGHLWAHVVATTDGRVSVFDVDPSVSPPTWKPVDAQVLGVGLQAVRVSPLTGRVYVSDNRATALHVYRMGQTGDPAQPWRMILEPPIGLPGSGLLDYGRGMALSSDGATLYLAWRSPNSILIIDIGPDDAGLPRNVLLDLVPIGSGPAQLVVAPTGPGGRDLVYASCFGVDSVWVLDPQLRAFEAIMPMPHGPYGLATVDVPGAGWKLYVALFGLHQVGVVPIEPTAAKRNTLSHYVKVAP
jgi:hypothetical protein